MIYLASGSVSYRHISADPRDVFSLSTKSPQDTSGLYVYLVKLGHGVSLIIICWRSLLPSVCKISTETSLWCVTNCHLLPKS